MKATITEIHDGKEYDIKEAPIEKLKGVYESFCDEYRRRLCEMWELRFEDSWWMADRVGEGLFLCDWWMPLDMPTLRYVVENNIAEKDWLEWCDFAESEIHNGKDHPRINFFSWMNGARPEMLKDDEQV